MDTNKESKEKEDASELMHEETEVAEKKPRVISVKMAAIIAGILVFGAIAFYWKGLFIAAMVNGSPVSRFVVIHELESASGKKALDTIITKKLLNDEAKKKEIVITSDDLNAEITKIEEQVKAQGGTLDAVLLQQGMTRKDMEEQITFQKKLEKLLADKIQVTDEEAMKFLTDSKVAVPKGEEDKFKEQAKTQIRGQKLNDAAGAFIESLKSDASIKYFVNY
jgi:foldase protein PrsA